MWVWLLWCAAQAPAAAGDPAPVAGPAPAVIEAPATPPVEPPAAPAAPVRSRLLRVAVMDVAALDVSDRLAPLFTASLVAELRKLRGVSVIGMDEVRQLLQMEADRQLYGCNDDGCSAELVDALGADVVVTARLARVGDAHLVSLRRLDAASAKTRGFDKRYEAGDGEEFLAAIGPAVAELFADQALRDGQQRGVAQEVGHRLNPPPVPVWLFAASATASGALLLMGGGAAVTGVLMGSSVQARVDESADLPVRGADLKRDLALAQGVTFAASAVLVLGVIGSATTTVLGLQTDFWGYGDAS